MTKQNRRRLIAAANQFREEAIARPHIVDDLTRRYKDDSIVNQKLLIFEMESVTRILNAYKGD